MKIKFCPQCAGIDIKALSAASDQCLRCKYTGDMKEGGMDEINSYKKSLKSGAVPSMPGQGAVQSKFTNAQLRERLNAMRGKSSGDVEFL